MSDHTPQQPGHAEATVIESVQSLIVAFVLAMTFRGFVTEGFVIPTGSMAPTLMGQHALLHSDQTGAVFPVSVDPDHRVPNMAHVPDPMLGPVYPRSANVTTDPARRMGDRILVLKSMYPFMEPDRFDVVVFKNPTDPVGKSANYIKRLIGLPNERIWLADGDVFVAPNDGDSSLESFLIQRKPEHIQLALWQPVYHSDFIPQKPDHLYNPGYRGSPWKGDGWDTTTRVYACDTGNPTVLSWDNGIRPLNDWTSYVSATSGRRLFAVSDLRVAAGVVADEPEELELVFRLLVRRHIFEFSIQGAAVGGQALVRWVAVDERDDEDAWRCSEAVDVELPEAGKVFDIEFWHVDQALSIYFGGERIIHQPYDWTAPERMRNVTGVTAPVGSTQWSDYAPDQPRLMWQFNGSPLKMHRVKLDRDLYYRADRLTSPRSRENPTLPEFETLIKYNSPAIATHPEKPAVLGPDHYFMLGDNSQASLDSRLWGSPHPLVGEQIDPTPFVVHRKLLIGKAWVVYFPAPFFARGEGMPVIPDFGRLRFIR